MKLTATDETLERALMALRQEARPFIVETRPLRKRSTLQNSRLWAFHTLTANYLNERHEQLMERLRALVKQDGGRDLKLLLGQIFALSHRWTPEDVHEQVFKPRFVHPRREKSSTRLSKTAMADAQTEYEAWMIEQGVDPEVMDRAA